jgi:hypothetical protein
LAKDGVTLPEGFTAIEGDTPLIKPARRAEDRPPDPWKPGS